jgi:hypothetical protein
MSRHVHLSLPHVKHYFSLHQRPLFRLRGRLHFSQLHLKFYDFQITFPGESIAHIQLTARLTGKTKAGEAVNEAHELDCLLKKVEKKWLFSQIGVVEVLKK